jgi:hypothetical protein
VNADDIKPGRYLRVPAGADLTRSLPYYCRVDRVEALSNHGYVHAMVTKTNIDGRPTRRWRSHDRAYRDVTAYIIANSLHGPAARPAAWYAPGADVVELEYLGHGRYSAERVTVTRVTPAQITTSSGRKFWRKTTGMVGQTSKRHAGIQVNPIRVVPLDNPHAVAYFEGKH